MTGRAGLISRGAAFTIDLALLTVVAYGCTGFVLLLRDALPRVGPHVHVGAFFFATAPLLFAIYHAAFWIVRGATPGQWLLGLEVRTLAGGPLRTKHALVRVVGYLVSAVPFYLGFLWVLAPSRRTWHDLLAGTMVVYAPAVR